MNPCQLLVRRALRDGDSAEEAARKRFVVRIVLSIGIFLAAYGVVSLTVYESQGAYIGYVATAAAMTIALPVYTLITRTLPLGVVELAMVVGAVSIILGDMAAAALPRATRPWFAIILVNDVLLTFGGRRFVQGICLHSMSVWLVISALEDYLRLGIYDIEGWTDVDDGTLRERLDCGNPPCAIKLGGAVGKVAIYVICLYVDFFATRGFAEGQKEEQERVKLMMVVAEQVAACLVKFDLDAAEAALDAAGAHGIPPTLGNSYRCLLTNLAGYRPYLPQSCFEEQDGSEGTESASNSGGGQQQDSGFSRGRVRSAAGLDTPKLSRLASMSSSTTQPRNESMSSGPGGSLTSPRVPPARSAHVIQSKRASLLACNRTDFLGSLAQGHLEPAPWMAYAVGHFSEVVLAQKGVVDTFCADHLQASFGALKHLGAHRIAAVRCAAALAADARIERDDPTRSPSVSLPFTSAVCTGSALCGDFGSAAAQRYMVIGGVGALIPAAERAAAGWGVAVLTDSDVQDDAQMHWDFRLRKVVCYPKVSRRQIGFWELIAEKEGRQNSPSEWMYELDNAVSNPWEAYNTIALQWATGRTDDALSLITTTLGAHSVGEIVAAERTPQVRAVLALQSAIGTEGDAGGAIDVPTAAGLGEALPL